MHINNATAIDGKIRETLFRLGSVFISDLVILAAIVSDYAVTIML